MPINCAIITARSKSTIIVIFPTCTMFLLSASGFIFLVCKYLIGSVTIFHFIFDYFFTSLAIAQTILNSFANSQKQNNGGKFYLNIFNL